MSGYYSANKYTAYKNGGKAQKGAYTTARTVLIAALDQNAEYIDGLAGLNTDMILLSGYTPTKTGDSKATTPATHHTMNQMWFKGIPID